MVYMTKIACLLLRIYVRRENTQTGIQLCFNLVFTTASQKSNSNRKIYVFRLFPTEWMFPHSALTLCQAKIVLCFLHEWGLHPSYVTDNGGNVVRFCWVFLLCTGRAVFVCVYVCGIGSLYCAICFAVFVSIRISVHHGFVLSAALTAPSP